MIPPRGIPSTLALCVCLAVAGIVWIGYRAVIQWQQNATQLAERRAESIVDLVVTTLTRDMREVQASVLAGSQSSADLTTLAASALARYPYPECFFAWDRDATPADVEFYCRSDRYPTWMRPTSDTNRFPMTVGNAPATAERLLERVAADGQRGRSYALFDIDLNGARYQVIGRLWYADELRSHPAGVFGFMVSMDWARQRYVEAVASQVMQIRNEGGDLTLTIADEHGGRIMGTPRTRDSEARRTFPLLFFDPRLVAVSWPKDLERTMLTADASLSAAPTLFAASVGAGTALGLVTVGAIVFAFGLLLMLRANRSSAQLVELRSEFVSTVTHELKTPIATIQAISETFARGRPVSAEVTRKYGRLALQESKRLARLVDNLLTYSRIADVTEVYSFEAIAPDTLVNQTLQEFGAQLEYGEFDVDVDVPADIPPIKADRKAMSLALGNLIDNAIRYSPDSHHLGIRARVNGRSVIVSITDKGIGIPESDIPHVTRKFFRGNRTNPGGSGLGLAIVDRVVADHGGSLSFLSTVGLGTTVSLQLPFAE